MKRALLIGLNYKGSDYQLEFCESDVKSIKELMDSCGVETRLISDSDNLGNRELNKLLDDYKAKQKPNDTFYIVYSGHGTQVPGDEPDQYDEALCLFKHGYIDCYLDQVLRSKLEGFKGHVVVIFDSCFSGGMERNQLPHTKKSVDLFRVNLGSITEKITPDQLPSNLPRINFMFSSSEDEVSYESNGHGFFTAALLKYWPNQKYISKLMSLIYKEVQHSQHPQLKKVRTTGYKKLF